MFASLIQGMERRHQPLHSSASPGIRLERDDNLMIHMQASRCLELEERIERLLILVPETGQYKEMHPCKLEKYFGMAFPVS